MTAIRSPRLLAAGLAMLAAAALLGGLLHHDGEVGLASDPAAAEAGESLRLKGTLVPWTVPPHRAAAWGDVARMLGNATYEVVGAADGPMVLATFGEDPGGAAASAQVVEGEVAWAGRHPTEPGRRLVLLAEPALSQPLVFR